MKELKIKKGNALKAYKGADDCAKKVLEDIFGKETFKVKIESVGDALEFLGEDDVDVRELRKMESVGLSDKKLDGQRLELVVKALNGGRFNTVDNVWYYPCFYKKDGGLSFGDSSWYSRSGNVSARLTLKDIETTKYCGKQFIDLYNKVYLP